MRVFAEDFTTIDGKKLEGVTVTRVEPDGIVVMTDSGIEKVAFARLPVEVQKKYGFDPAKAAQFQQQRAGTAAMQRVMDAEAMQAEEALKRAPQGVANVPARLPNPSAPENLGGTDKPAVSVPGGLKGTTLDQPVEFRGTVAGIVVEQKPDGLRIRVTQIRSKKYTHADKVYVVVKGAPPNPKSYLDAAFKCTAVLTKELIENEPGEKPMAVFQFVNW